MDRTYLRKLLESIRSCDIDIEEAMDKLRDFPTQNLDYARIDNHRPLRCGFPEVVYCPGKSAEEIASILSRMADGSDPALLMATRADQSIWEIVQKQLPEATFHPRSGVILFRRGPEPVPVGEIAMISAGTADRFVLEEAILTARAGGANVVEYSDVGVAGVHRLFAVLPQLRRARVLVVVAGMEGALPSLVAGLVDRPVIAVPTSVGYGAHFHGLAPLLSMLTACAPGISVVNIDNGFAAGYQAALINRLTCTEESTKHVDQ